MKKVLLCWLIILSCFYTTEAQVLSPVAAFIFKNIKTPISNTDKNLMAADYKMAADGEAVELKDAEGSRTSVSVYPTDMNRDGIDELFILTSNSFYFGNVGSNCILYVKDKAGKYVLQEMSAPILKIRSTFNLEYPDIIESDYMPLLWQEPRAKATVYRWNGKKYTFYKNDQPYKKDDINVDEVSAKYVGGATTQTIAQVPVVELNSGAAILFANVKTSLATEEKNDIANLTGITASDTSAKTKKGKPKNSFVVYPVDLNKDGKEEIFICAKTLTLGITVGNYYFYAKGIDDKYKSCPGKIGVLVRIIDVGKNGYPDLITGTEGLTREIWSWNGSSYYLRQKINGNTNYKLKEIAAESIEYTNKL